MIIGVSGTFGSGKDTVAKIIESKGFEHFSTADILRVETANLGRSIERESLRQTGNELRAKFGSGFLAEKAINRASTDNILVSGIRSRGEIDNVINHKNSYLIFVDAPVAVRFKRISDRGRNIEDFHTMEKFKKSEVLELKGDVNSQNILYCRKKADFVLQNDGTLEDLEKKIDEILVKIK